MRDFIKALRPGILGIATLPMGCGGAGTASHGGNPWPPAVPSSASPAARQTALAAAVPVPVIQSFTAVSTATRHGAFYTLTAVFTGGTGIIDPNVGPVAPGEAVSTVTITGTTTFTLTVSNAAGDKATQAVTVTPQVDASLFSYWWW